MGYADTMGAKFIDYLLADRWLINDELAQHCSEQIVYLPQAFVSSSMPLADTVPNRRDCGLPDDAVVFCCFNAYYKIDPPVFDAWMQILQQVPEGILWLKTGPAAAMDNLRREARKRGIEPSRLYFADNLPEPEYLARYRVANLFLDTFSYCASSTGVCALYAGLPLLTRPGVSNASRMGASLCAAAGLGDLICTDTDSYVQTAVDLACQPARLAEHRQRLATRQAPIFDIKRFAGCLETAYRQMWAQYQQGQAP
jgi:predicted O-linked N-acetylglucosamine transferase (SPINDLY family)